MNDKMFFQFPRLSESSATLGTQIFLLDLLLLSLLPCFLGFAGGTNSQPESVDSNELRHTAFVLDCVILELDRKSVRI